jgi:hypothetical protein
MAISSGLDFFDFFLYLHESYQAEFRNQVGKISGKQADTRWQVRGDRVANNAKNPARRLPVHIATT